MSWNDELINILEKIRINSIALSEKHRKRFLEFKSISKYFDLPVIVCSVFSSSFTAIGSISDTTKNLITTAISMFIAILTSIKLYLNLNTSINDEIALSKDFYILSVNIFKVLSLKPEDREISPLQFLNDCYSNYIKLIEQSSLLRNNIKHDELTKLDINKFMSEDTESTKSRSEAAVSSNSSQTSSSDDIESPAATMNPFRIIADSDL